MYSRPAVGNEYIRPAGSAGCSMLCCSLPCGRREWRELRHNWKNFITGAVRGDNYLVAGICGDVQYCLYIIIAYTENLLEGKLVKDLCSLFLISKWKRGCSKLNVAVCSNAFYQVNWYCATLKYQWFINLRRIRQTFRKLLWIVAVRHMLNSNKIIWKYYIWKKIP